MRFQKPRPTPARAPRVAAALIFAAAATLAAAAPAAGQGRSERADMGRARGAADAPVRVYEIADFQCPYCARFSREVFPRLDSAYVREGRVQWVFVNLPLPSHARAWVAAEAALCAGAVREGGFWPLHDRLFSEQRAWSEAEEPLALFLAYARDAGIPLEPFRACVQSDAVATVLLEDIINVASARVAGGPIRGTPTFIVDNGISRRPLIGLKSFDEWRALLEESLRERETGRP